MLSFFFILISLSSLSPIKSLQSTISDLQAKITITGKSGDVLGAKLAYADVNCDGIDDLILGSSTVDANTGIVYVIYGGASVLPVLDLKTTTLDPDTTGFIVNPFKTCYINLCNKNC